MSHDPFEQSLKQSWTSMPGPSPLNPDAGPEAGHGTASPAPEPNLLATPLVSFLLRRSAKRALWETRSGDLGLLLYWSVFALLFAAVAGFGEVLLCRIGGAMLSAAFFYGILRLIRDGWWQSPSRSGQDSAVACAEFYRAQLIRRRDIKRNLFWWFVAPTAPGVLVGTLGWILAAPHDWFTAGGMVAVWAALCWSAVMDSNRQADRLQKEIDLLH